MLHGAIVWLVALPLLLFVMALGAGALYGSWYGGLAGTPAWVQPAAATAANAAATGRPASGSAPVAADPEAARAARNSALGTLTAVLLGLVGGVVGGWAASGEPMTFTYHRRRPVPERRSGPTGRGEPSTPGATVPPAIRHGTA
jgi:hypothetical protein